MTSRLLARAGTLLTEGKVVGVPTDTVYGLATRRSATEALFRLKGRPPDKAIPVLVGSVAQARRLAVFTPTAERLADAHWPGPLTLVMGVRSEGKKSEETTVGLRMPDHPVILDLLAEWGPLAVTSANRSGENPAKSDLQAREIFGGQVEVYLPGVCPGGVASTVIAAMPGRDPRILRPGPITL